MMPERKEKIGNWFETTGLICITFFVLSYPFSPKLAVAGILLYFLLAIAGKRWNPVSLKSVPVPLWAAMTFYLLHIISMIYSENNDYGFRDLEVKMGLFLIPLASILIPRTVREVSLFRNIFVITACISIVVCLFHSLGLYLETSKVNSFFYDSFSYLMHPTYYTMLLNVALLLHLSPADKGQAIPLYRSSFLYYGVYLLLLMAVVLTSSRAGLVIVLFTGCGYILYSFRNDIKNCITQLLVLIAITGFLFTAVLLSNPESRFGILLREAFGIKQTKSVVDEKEVDVSPLSHRMQLWDTAWGLCKRYPLGTGVGDVQDVLVAEYTRTGFEKAREVKYNPHNQFLQSWLAIGIPGFLLLLLVYWGTIKKLFSKHDIYFFLASIIALNGLFESVLEVQRGVILFALIIMFYGISVEKDENYTIGKG